MTAITGTPNIFPFVPDGVVHTKNLDPGDARAFGVLNDALMDGVTAPDLYLAGTGIDAWLRGKTHWQGSAPPQPTLGVEGIFTMGDQVVRLSREKTGHEVQSHAPLLSGFVRGKCGMGLHQERRRADQVAQVADLAGHLAAPLVVGVFSLAPTSATDIIRMRRAMRTSRGTLPSPYEIDRNSGPAKRAGALATALQVVKKGIRLRGESSVHEIRGA